MNEIVIEATYIIAVGISFLSSACSSWSSSSHRYGQHTRGQRSWHWGCELKAQADASLCGTVYVRCYLWLPWGCYWLADAPTDVTGVAAPLWLLPAPSRQFRARAPNSPLPNINHSRLSSSLPYCHSHPKVFSSFLFHPLLYYLCSWNFLFRYVICSFNIFIKYIKWTF